MNGSLNAKVTSTFKRVLSANMTSGARHKRSSLFDHNEFINEEIESKFTGKKSEKKSKVNE